MVLVLHDLAVDPLLQLQLPFQLGLLPPLSFMKLVLDPLGVHSGPFYNFLFLPASVEIVDLLFFIEAVLVGEVEAGFEGVEVLAEDF